VTGFHVLQGVEEVKQLEYNDGDWLEPNWKQVARFDSNHRFFHINEYELLKGSKICLRPTK